MLKKFRSVITDRFGDDADQFIGDLQPKKKRQKIDDERDYEILKRNAKDIFTLRQFTKPNVEAVLTRNLPPLVVRRITSSPLRTLRHRRLRLLLRAPHVSLPSQ